MMRSLYSGVSGLKNHQTRMDVIGNNIANVNTIGFKKNTVQFKDQLYQTISAASGPSNATGGTNPQQVGMGVTLGAIGTLHTQGNMQFTGGGFHMGINGDGFFTVKNSDGQELYTRAGDFALNVKGELVDQAGNYVMMVPARYVPDPNAVAPDLGKFSFSASEPDTGAPPNVVPGDLNDRDPATGGKVQISSEFFSSVAVSPAGAIVGKAARALTKAELDAMVPPILDAPAGGLPAGSSIVIGFADIAQFANPEGLEKVGNNLYQKSDNSGNAVRGVAGGKGRGEIAPNSLEMSNVDMSEEMVSMIVTQRGFQANSRVITTSDSMLEELVNLKR